MSSKKKKSKENKDEIIETVQFQDDLPVLATSDLVAFPSVLMSLYIFDEKNQKAILAAEESGVLLMVSTQLNAGENFALKDLPKIGVVAQINRIFKMNDGRIKVLLQGLVRADIKKLTSGEDYITAKIEPIISEPKKPTGKVKEVIKGIQEKLQLMVELEQLPEEILLVTEDVEDAGALADVIIAHYKLDNKYAQSLLEELDPIKRLELTYKIIEDDFNNYLISENIRSKAETELSKGQRDFYLREQLKQIQRELGGEDQDLEDLSELKEAIVKAKLPNHVEKEVTKQMKRLERMPVESSEHAMIRTYLEWVVDVPWSIKTKEKFDLKGAKEVLDEDHYGLEKAKDRILEFLSVRKLKKDSKGPILCFLGPPGVGKTSLGRSIAKSLNRKFVRLSLGGVRDEAEIRGHRRTYVGALPGRIIQGLKEAGSNNPVFMLDELDKIGSDYRGDPAAALLEILDPQQNSDFRDHYLSVGCDLSDCLFVATANTLDTIPDALLDRLEIISIPGYTNEEKRNIANKYLIPRQIKENGLEKKGISFVRDAVLFLVERYTREAGVRNLERLIGSVCRKIARSIVAKEKVTQKINSKFIVKCLGSTYYDPEFSGKEDQVGLVNGLAWTMNGGEILPVEVSTAKGNGSLALTGQLGEVLQESGQAAVFYARSNYKDLGLNANFYSELDIHIHLPEGATPKDGPSAGITMATALVSALSGRKVKSSVAMTGEITLRGNVLPIGGLKEKALAAIRYGIDTVIIPHGNIKDLDDIPKEQRKLINFVPVKTICEVLDVALEKPKKKKAKAKTKKKVIVKSV